MGAAAVAGGGAVVLGKRGQVGVLEEGWVEGEFGEVDGAGASAGAQGPGGGDAGVTHVLELVAGVVRTVTVAHVGQCGWLGAGFALGAYDAAVLLALATAPAADLGNGLEGQGREQPGG